MHISALVRAEAHDRFEAIDAAKVLLLLEGVELPFLSGPDADGDRVQLGLLKLSEGSLPRFQQELQRARIDWRDILDTAGLHRSDWRSVLRGWGFRVPEE
jgi:hypothetical protein